MTEKLYDQDAYLQSFTATVLACEKADNGYAVTLDSTAFFPESGGQQGDRGKIGDAFVFDTKIVDGVILHYTDSPLKTNEQVLCEINFDERFAKMQNHTGEHIVSGIFYKLYGAENVGFHLHDNIVTFDTSLPLTTAQLEKSELLANKAVWENRPIFAYYPPCDELKKLDYRSKGELEGDVRIVEIDGYDRCACCAPHVSSTGQVGLIKFISAEPHRRGMRIQMVCGEYALDDYKQKFKTVSELSSLLCAPKNEVTPAVIALQNKISELEYDNRALKNLLCKPYAQKIAESDKNTAIIGDFDAEQMREIANAANDGLIAGVFSGNDEKGYRYTLKCTDAAALCQFTARLNSELSGRGGGRGQMTSGSVNAKRAQILEFFKTNQTAKN